MGAEDVGRGNKTASFPPVDNTTDTTVLYNLLKPDIRVDDDDDDVDDALVSKNKVVTKTKLRVRIMTPPPSLSGERKYIKIPSNTGAPKPIIMSV